MKVYLTLIMLLALFACNDSKKAAELARQAVLDSVNLANDEVVMRQRIIDSMNTVNSVAATPATSTSAPTKKKMSNTTKGALIGAGAGIITGAVTGAAVSKNKGKGAVVGGVIGGAVGSGIGYGAGSKIDNK